MEIKEILRHCDHTVLAQTAAWTDIRTACDDAIHYHCASVCIPPCYVREAAEHIRERVPVCTVIGFPNGYDTILSKRFMAANAVENGADEIDMVTNICFVKDRRWDELLWEVQAVREVCKNRVLKVIVEACFLTEEEKIHMCHLVTDSGADFIKTSTGFGTGGATREDVALFAKHIGGDVKIKAAGGIRTLKDGEDFINLGATRIGTSRIVQAVKELESSGSGSV